MDKPANSYLSIKATFGVQDYILTNPDKLSALVDRLAAPEVVRDLVNSEKTNTIMLLLKIFSLPQNKKILTPDAASAIAENLAQKGDREKLIEFIEILDRVKSGQKDAEAETSLVSALIAPKVIKCLMGEKGDDEIAERSLKIIVGEYGDIDEDNYPHSATLNLSPDNLLKVLQADGSKEGLAKEDAFWMIHDFVKRQDVEDWWKLLASPGGAVDLFSFMGPKYLSYVLDYVGNSIDEYKGKFFSNTRMVETMLEAAEKDMDFAERLQYVIRDFTKFELGMISAGLGPKLFVKLMAACNEDPLHPEERKMQENKTPPAKSDSGPVHH